MLLVARPRQSIGEHAWRQRHGNSARSRSLRSTKNRDPLLFPVLENLEGRRRQVAHRTMLVADDYLRLDQPRGNSDRLLREGNGRESEEQLCCAFQRN